MAIFGLSLPRNMDVPQEFFQRKIACTGYSREDDPAGYIIFRQFRAEDLIYLRAPVAPADLKVKAVGLVASNFLIEDDLGCCVRVNWLWQGEKLIENLDDDDPSRAGTAFEEYNTWVQREILDLLPDEYRLTIV